MTEGMNYCENCGAANAPGVKFCGACGRPIQSKFCEQCGAKLTPGIRFCESCGSPVGAPTPVQPVPRPPLVQPTAAAQDWQAAPPAAWTQPADGLEADRPRMRKKRRGCLWVLLVLILLLLALVVAAVLLGWVSYTSGNLIIFPNGVPFIATPTPRP